MESLVNTCPNQLLGPAGQIFSALLQVIVASQCDLVNPDKWPEDYGPKLHEGPLEYDFIVVGAGSAGSVVAARLAEVSDWKILLLEAGGDPPLETEIPGIFYTTLGGNIDWGYTVETSDKHSLGMRDKRCPCPRGKVLGGCSSINAMLYVRGNRRDYDDWEKMGNTGWGYDNIIKYFKKSENMQTEKILKKDGGKYHNSEGELKLSHVHLDIPIINHLADAVKEMGYQVIDDMNAEEYIGYTKSPLTIDGGTRYSSAKAFLSQRKKNLHVVKNALVTKILINPDTKQAEGVEFLNKEGKKITVRSTKEVIVSGGAINTPQILMLSGVGPSAELSKHNISVLADLPVGKNLQDHVYMPYFIEINKSSAKELTTQQVMDILYMYLMHKVGPLSGLGTTDFLGFINTVNSTSKYPNIELFTLYFPKRDSLGLPNFLGKGGFEDSFTKSILEKNVHSDIIMFVISLLNPKSVGEIKLRSSNPTEQPLIYMNYFDDEDDVETLLQGCQYMSRFINTNAMKSQEAKIVTPILINCDHLEFDSDEYWRCAIRNVASTVYHPVSTAKMGPAGDKTAVVSPELKVHGVKRLRVIDASIMPKIISGNTNAATVMIGEKGADLIKEEWNLFKGHSEL